MPNSNGRSRGDNQGEETGGGKGSVVPLGKGKYGFWGDVYTVYSCLGAS